MKKKTADYLYLFSIAGLIIAADQATKILVQLNLDYGQYWSPWAWLARYARVIRWQNTGAAFGMFQDLNLVFMILAIVVSALIIYYFPQVPRHEWYLRLAMSMQLGGALGNLIDRIRDGFVTDFISVGKFAVFNIADASISVGVAVLLLGILWRDWQAQRQAKLAAASAPREDVVTPGQAEPSGGPEGESPEQDVKVGEAPTPREPVE